MNKHARSLVGLIRNRLTAGEMIVGAEVGVWRGEMSESLLAAIPNLLLYMIDPWEFIEPTATMRKGMDDVVAARLEAHRRVELFMARRVVIQDTSLGVANSLLLGVHFAFIDACHLYESVRDDVQAWWEKVKDEPGSFISGHDYNGVGDRRCGWGVKRAVDEFAASKGLQVNVLPGNVWWIAKGD